MPWLLRDDEVLAAVEVASSYSSRWRHLAGRDFLEGALLLDRARSVHTIAVRFSLDVAYCTRGPEGSLTVLSTRAMPRWRIGRPRPRARCVIAAQTGAFERWRLAPGDLLVLR